MSLNDEVRGEPFLRPAELCFLAATMAVLLWLLFPGADFQDPKYLARPDELSIAYLRTLLRAQPGNRSARLLLAEQQFALGHWEETRQSLAPLLAHADDIAATAQRLALRLDRARLAAASPSDPERPSIIADIKAATRRLLAIAKRSKDAADLAEASLSIADPVGAAAAYERAAALDAPAAPRWLEAAAGAHLQASAPGAAGGDLARAADLTSDPALSRRLAVAALAALTGANQGVQAMPAVTALVERHRDPAVLEGAVKMALACGDLPHARQWGQERMALGGASDQLLSQQLDIQLGAGDPEGAYRIVQQLLARNPSDAALRRRTAQLATWTDRPREALEAWAWLARHGSEEARKEALALAIKLSDTDRFIEMLELRIKRLRRAAPPDVGVRKASLPRAGTSCAPAAKPAPAAAAETIDISEVLLLAEALEDKGQPERAIAVLESFRETFSYRIELWNALWHLHEAVGDLPRALAIVDQVAGTHGATVDDVVRAAELLWRLHRPEEALGRLVAARNLARENDEDYWTLMGELAWLREKTAEALDSYRMLWRTQKTALVAERLCRLLEDVRRPEEALVVAEEGFARLEQPDLLVVAVDSAVALERWDKVRELLRHADRPPARYDNQVQLWLGRALLAAHERRSADAERSLQRALAIDPRSVDAHREWLAVAVQARDRDMTHRALEHWGRDAQSDPEGAEAVAEARELLAEGDVGDQSLEEEALDAAIEGGDRVAIAAALRAPRDKLSLHSRVAALRELGREDDAWDELEAAGITRASAAVVQAAGVAEDLRELREDHLDGSSVDGEIQILGPVETRGVEGRAEIRRRALTFGFVAGADRVIARPGSLLVLPDHQEGHTLLTARLREGFGETSLRAGLQFLPSGALPALGLVQNLALPQLHLEAHLEAVTGELPTNTALMRAAAQRQGGEATVLFALPLHLEVGGSLALSHYTTRQHEQIADEMALEGELALRLPLGSAYLRPRVDAFRNRTANRAEPARLADLLTADAEVGDELAVDYSMAGVGITLGSGDAEVGEARGAAGGLRYRLDAWAGRLWPARTTTFAVEAALGLVLAHHQEVAAAAFYYRDRGGEPGQQYRGATLKYTLRWDR
jgi:tetratricopeptide (TPR) repeat protein